MRFPSLRRMFYGFIGGVFLTLALFLIGVDIYRASGMAINWPVLWQEIRERVRPDPVILPDEVQNFVLFSEVHHSSGKVVTGTEYSSTHDQSIKKQWCYVSRAAKAGESVSRLSLADINENGVKTTPEFAPAALRQFELTNSSVRALIRSHCRFK